MNYMMAVLFIQKHIIFKTLSGMERLIKLLHKTFLSRQAGSHEYNPVADTESELTETIILKLVP